MSDNHHASNVNEISVGYFLNHNRFPAWQFGSSEEQSLKDKEKIESREERAAQSFRGYRQAHAVFQYLRTVHPTEKIEQVHWVGQLNTMTPVVGFPVEQRENPADLLLQFESGQFLGISCKSTTTHKDICFKNLGVSHFKDVLGLDLHALSKEAEQQFLEDYPELPTKQIERKKYLRAHPHLHNECEKRGTHVMGRAGRMLTRVLKLLPQETLRAYLLRYWLNDACNPPWIRCTGWGTGKTRYEYHAHIGDPSLNEGPYMMKEYCAVRTQPLTLETRGKYTQNVAVKAGDVNAFKIRGKYESQKLASAMKFLGEPI